ncbi:MFS transporter [Desulfotalea psychrophila]|uniref:Related to efflux pump antibiotic resistance protein n=1 Tax=Desulfotalea psychrophila (strain LSv54 / DSM 12343) TaxID=177439 RepID=Q6AM35_DESPS|nr:MFS transporter [Desulfotalea psychrophila]CAG36590.1 related to efflux pump antibiotic resistance protein [Desulfotalea psychrophila LSv54]
MSIKQKNGEASTIILVSIVQFITPFMASGVSVALPTIGRHFSASAFQLGLAEMIYILGVSIFLLAAGQLADIFGRKKIFLMGICGFIISTFAITATRSMGQFLLVRFVQGLSVSFIATTTFAILSSVVPRERRGKSMGIVLAFVYAGLSAGPALGGFIVFQFNWHWLFVFAGLLASLALLLCLKTLKGEWWGSPEQKFDYRGCAVYMLSLSFLVVGVAGHTMVGGYAAALVVAGIVGLSFFFWLETRVKSPMLDVRMIFANRVLFFTVLAALINYGASFAIIFFFSLYLQSVKGLLPQVAGSVLILQTLVQCILSPLSGKLADKIYPGKIATLGMFVGTIGLGMASLIEQESSVAMVALVFVVVGVGFGLFASPNMTIIMNSVPQEAYGQASSLTATVRTLGMLTSMAIASLLVSHFMGDTPINKESIPLFMKSLQGAMLTFTLMSLVGVFLSLGRAKAPTNEP